MARGIPAEHEAVYARHVAIHTRQAVLDLEKALAPLPQESQLHRTISDALKPAREAARIAGRWRAEATGEEPGLFDPTPETDGPQEGA